MPAMGQTEKKSVRAYVFRFALKLGHRSTHSVCLKRANWRFLDAGRHSAWKGSSCRRPKTLYGAYWCQGESGGAVESFCHVTRLHLRHGQPLARLRRAVKPQSRLRGAEVTPQPCIRSIRVWIAP